MKLYDQHLHTSLSYDSEESFEKYLEQAMHCNDDTFVSTEHMDLSCCYYGGIDKIPDFDLQLERLDALRSVYPTMDLRMGVEVGYKPSVETRIRKILREYPFDVVLLSIHENETADVTTPGFLKGKTAEEAYGQYLELYLQAVERFDDYDVLAHVDYLLRYIDEVNLENHRASLESIFQAVIKKGKSLELNTRFIYQKKDTHYLSFLLALYRSCGGTRISLGSDGHQIAAFQGGFAQAVELLHNNSFHYVIGYGKRTAYQISI